MRCIWPLLGYLLFIVLAVGNYGVLDDLISVSQASAAEAPSGKNLASKSSSVTSLDLADAASLGLGTLPLHNQDILTQKLHDFLDRLALPTTLRGVRRHSILAGTPSVCPTKGTITSRFGWRPSPVSGASTYHKGLDIAKNNGAPIVAPANGIVTFAGRQRGYGNCVEIRHANGITTMYAHMRSYTIKCGQKVKRYDVIGYVGNSGRTTGPHLHYEVRERGKHVDPMKYILH